MQKKLFILFLALVAFTTNACFLGNSANGIIKRSIQFYGMDKLNGKTIDFDFREKHFTIKLNKGDYFYQSTFKDSLGLVKDQLQNSGFVRERDGIAVKLSPKDSVKYSESLNSVVYFALLPLKLKDDAVKAKLLRNVQVKGKEYRQVEVSFGDKNGGSHHEDVFYFWFDAKDSSMDYFAYSKGGNRFRALNGSIGADGIRLQNYTNLENSSNSKTELKDYHVLFEQDKLHTLSKITLTNLKIK